MPPKIVRLDVRQLLQARQKPFNLIMDTVQSVTEADVFELHAPFSPVPLIKLLGKKGYASSQLRLGPKHYATQFRRRPEHATNPDTAAYALDCRALEHGARRALLADIATAWLHNDSCSALELWLDEPALFSCAEELKLVCNGGIRLETVRQSGMTVLTVLQRGEEYVGNQS